MPRINWEDQQGRLVDPELDWRLTQLFEQQFGPLLEFEHDPSRPFVMVYLPPVSIYDPPPQFVQHQYFRLLPPPDE